MVNAAFVNNVTDEEYRQFGLSLETVTTGINNAFAPKMGGSNTPLRLELIDSRPASLLLIQNTSWKKR